MLTRFKLHITLLCLISYVLLAVAGAWHVHGSLLGTFSDTVEFVAKKNASETDVIEECLHCFQSSLGLSKQFIANIERVPALVLNNVEGFEYLQDVAQAHPLRAPPF